MMPPHIAQRLLAESPRWKSVTICKSYWPNGNVCVRMGNYEMRGVIVNNTPEDAKLIMKIGRMFPCRQNKNAEIACSLEMGQRVTSVR